MIPPAGAEPAGSGHALSCRDMVLNSQHTLIFPEYARGYSAIRNDASNFSTGPAVVDKAFALISGSLSTPR